MADLIIALGREGKIVEQGSFSQLLASDGYVQSLTAKRAIAPNPEVHQDEVISESRAEATAPKVAYKAKQVEIKDDKRRQLGDSTVYKYYFGSIGPIFIIILFSLEIVWAFLQSFPSKPRTQIKEASPCFFSSELYLITCLAVWLKFWTDSNSQGHTRSGLYLGVFSALQVIGVLWFALLIW